MNPPPHRIFGPRAEPLWRRRGSTWREAAVHFCTRAWDIMHFLRMWPAAAPSCFEHGRLGSRSFRAGGSGGGCSPDLGVFRSIPPPQLPRLRRISIDSPPRSSSDSGVFGPRPRHMIRGPPQPGEERQRERARARDPPPSTPVPPRVSDGSGVVTERR